MMTVSKAQILELSGHVLSLISEAERIVNAKSSRGASEHSFGLTSIRQPRLRHLTIRLRIRGWTADTFLSATRSVRCSTRGNIGIDPKESIPLSPASLLSRQVLTTRVVRRRSDVRGLRRYHSCDASVGLISSTKLHPHAEVALQRRRLPRIDPFAENLLSLLKQDLAMRES